MQDSEPSSAWGGVIVIFGAAIRGAATLPRFAAMAGPLRFAGAPMMLLGSVVSVYELGGWRLLLGIPATAVAAFAGGTVLDARRERTLKEDAVQEVRAGCADVPSDALDALREAPAREYETNRIALDVDWPAAARAGSTEQWRLHVSASRQNIFKPWSITSLRASHADMSNLKRLGAAGGPPPQTRHWDPEATPIRWEV